jgi:Reverse transcriptase (RNA-dependent DNA polymerase)
VGYGPETIRKEHGEIQVDILNKTHLEGKVAGFKARLVAKGYTQIYGVDYEKTFTPVVKMNIIRTLISCAVNFG